MIAPEALTLIKEFEGYMHELKDGTGRVRAYQDPGDVPTIGWGSTRYFPGAHPVKLGDAPIDRQRATECLEGELDSICLPAIRKYISVSLHPLMEGALASWTYNLGTGHLQASTLRVVINKKQWDRVPAEFRKWKLGPPGTPVGLLRRRNAEADLFMKGVALLDSTPPPALPPSMPTPISLPPPPLPQTLWTRFKQWILGQL